MSQLKAPNAPPTPSHTVAAATPSHALDLYNDFAQQADNDSRGLRHSLLFAAVLHGVLLLITFPNLYSHELQAKEPPRKVMRLNPTPRFKPPPPTPTEVPRPKTRKVPIPDPTPEAPEPLYVETPTVNVHLPDTKGLTFIIPDRPPEPESSEPIILHGGVVKPERTHYVAPEYTEIARRVRHQGPVILQTVIDVEGNVQEVNVLKGLNFGLTESALAAVKQWKFKPALLNGRPVAVYYNLTVNFSLQ